jgi:nucleotide-binding universal stress UspA family protein
MSQAPLFVVPVDFSPDMEGTVSAAFALANECGAHVHVLEVMAAREASKRDWSRLEHSIEAASRRGIHVRVVTYPGAATKVIPAHVQLAKARLLVLGQYYGTSRWRRNTTVVRTLSRSAPVPVLILPPRLAFQKGKKLSFGHIVSAVDFTVASAVAVRTVVDLIRRTGARLTLVHALKNAPNRTVFSGGEAMRVARNLRAQAGHVAERLRRRVPADVRIRADARVTTGDPHRGILDTASEVAADLIVLGIPPRSQLDLVLFGSTLRHILRRTKIPVLVLPVAAGAYKWLEETDGVEAARTATKATHTKRLLMR